MPSKFRPAHRHGQQIWLFPYPHIYAELRRIPIPLTSVNKGKKRRAGAALRPGPDGADSYPSL